MLKKLLIISALISVLFSCKKDDVTTSGSSEKPKTVQERLDDGELPVEIFSSDSTLLDSLYGKSYEGGLIIYLDMTDSSGIVAASENQTSSSQWGCNTTLLSFTDCPPIPNFPCFTITLAAGQGIGTGLQNTNDIINNCGSGAAKIAFDLDFNGYSDWYLPSSTEAKIMLNNLNLIGTYWTSTQSSKDRAWSISKSSIEESAYSLTLPKSGWKNVRSIRNF